MIEKILTQVKNISFLKMKALSYIEDTALDLCLKNTSVLIKQGR